MERRDQPSWEGVRERVRALGRSQARQSVFGAKAHDFTLGDPLTPAELAEAEARWVVRVPDDYREFLLTVGSGGAGPYYGLVGVCRGGSRWGWDGRGGASTDVGRLGDPFPGRIGPVTPREALAAQPPDATDEAHHAWLERYEDWLFSDDRTVGAVCLAHQGCGYYDWLIVSGPFRGQVWTDNRASDGNLAPASASFIDWYLDWLREAEKTVAKAESPDQGRGRSAPRPTAKMRFRRFWDVGIERLRSYRGRTPPHDERSGRDSWTGPVRGVVGIPGHV